VFQQKLQEPVAEPAYAVIQHKVCAAPRCRGLPGRSGDHVLNTSHS
jgi:hypothetical protein